MKMMFPTLLLCTLFSTAVMAEDSIALITVQGSGAVAAAPDQPDCK